MQSNYSLRELNAKRLKVFLQKMFCDLQNSRSSTSSITIKTASLEEKKINDFLDSVHKEKIDRDVTTTTQDEAPSSTIFTLLYEKLCDAMILADRKTQEAIACYCLFGKSLIQRRNEIASERQVDPESNIVGRILNKKVKAQLPTDTSDNLLRKRIEKAKKLYKLF
ncbi:1509_t:CDS:2 [Acaulospora morrowiae]|uniref:1509_t:CDS:1 n=1 Tax=Acaulospora morrowiae TaxID=94023 RepID=A0A9N9BW27_9GLOM|nr:1509_t:CDS:2 [Acaulospora morrowiae]